MQDTKETVEQSPEMKDEPAVNDKDKTQPVSEGQYYYDDAHGYEDFDPEAADQDDDK